LKRALLQRHIEEAESRIQRGQRNIDIQHEAVSELERASQDATIAKALLTLFEKALVAIHLGAASKDSPLVRRASHGQVVILPTASARASAPVREKPL